MKEKIELLEKEVNNIIDKGLLKGPDSTNPLGLKKWFTSEIKKITDCMDKVESNLEIVSSCKKGCCSCCKQAIEVINPEWKAISAVIKRFSEQEKQMLMEKNNECIKLIEDNGIKDEMKANFSSPARNSNIDNFMKSYFAINIECPLLSAHGECLIYDVRPACCWGYRMYGSSEECTEVYNPDNAINFESFDTKLLNLAKKKISLTGGMRLLPYIIRDILDNKI